MNVVFVGGGSFRTLPIVRSAMKGGKILRNGTIWLVDFNLERAEAVGRLLQRTPEMAGSGCRVFWTDKIDKALPGTDVVSVSFPVGSPGVNRLSEQACLNHGLFGSDQISISGAFRAMTGGAILRDIARRMEKHCPKAWLVDFANPVAVYSGMINNHTKIKALGVCGGFENHRWDLSRLLFDKDEYGDEFKVTAAGVNHCSILLGGTYRGQDIYKMIDRKIGRKGWKPCRIPTMNPVREGHVKFGLERLAEMRRRFGHILFSTEGDGMMHLFFERMRGPTPFVPVKPLSAARLKAMEKGMAAARRQADLAFRAHLDRDLDAAFWAQDAFKNPHFAVAEGDATALVLRALAGERQWLAASLPNRGAVKGFKDRTVLEYSMHLDARGVHPDPNLEVPDCFHGLMTSLATHQTLLGDAIATRDPKIFANALYCYPLNQNMKATRQLWHDLLKIHAPEIPKEFQKAADYF
jgi:6-phospho-beta-glucosidase